MKIRNVGGINPELCRCGNWLNHWKNFSGQKIPYYCPVIGCGKSKLSATFVQIVSGVDSGWYVVPLCEEHSKTENEILEIDDYCKIVTANVNMTCELYK
ncbi:MAG: hypothetical protein ACE14Q_07535 [Acidobacteriota bacterium]